MSQLMASLDSISPGQVVVLGATSRPEHIEPALRRAGRFDREIHIGLPDEAAKRKILTLMTAKTPLAADLDLGSLARNIPGFAPADIKALLREAGHRAIDRFYQSNSMLNITAADIQAALAMVQPAAKREGFAIAPETTWDSIGALKHVRDQLRMAVVEPLRNPSLFARIGITTPSGVLLWGPPGCGKTLLAKAVANETHSNFISVKGPELLNKYVGESERAVRSVFERARISAPCIIFLDELESLCARRSDPGENHAARVVNQFLTELDGLESRRNVYIIGATNRPGLQWAKIDLFVDMIDAAMLRPGRLDKHIYVQLPTSSERCDILAKLTMKTPLATDVDIGAIATQVEGYSGADLSNLVRIASEHAIQPFLSCPESNPDDLVVNGEHFDTAISMTRPSVSENERLEYDLLARDFRIGDTKTRSN